MPITAALRQYLDRYTPLATTSPDTEAWQTSGGGSRGGWFLPAAWRGWRDPDNFARDLRAANADTPGTHGSPGNRLRGSSLDYRHTLSSQLAQRGVSLFKISALMGNSAEICRRHYASLIPETMTSEVEFAYLSSRYLAASYKRFPMAKKTGFSVYQIKIRDAHKRDSWVFKKGTTDGYALLVSYFKSRKGKLIRLGEKNDTDGSYIDNRAIKLVKLEHDDATQTIRGRFTKGEAGLVKDVFDLDDPDNPTPSKTINKNEADLTPLYFEIHIENGHPFGIAILQTFGKDGLKGFLQDDFVKGIGKSHTVRLTQYLNGEVLAAMAKAGKLQDVILINRGASDVSKDRIKEASVGGQHLGEAGDRLELRLHRSGGWFKKTLETLLAKRKKKDELASTLGTPLGEDFDDLFVEINEGGRTQRFSLLNPDDSPVRYDKSAQIMIGSNGFPTYVSLKKAANDVWLSIEKMLRWNVRGGN